MPTSWLYQWLDGLEIASEEDLDTVLREANWARFAVELASTAEVAQEGALDSGVPTIIAGRRMDLSARYSCAAPTCQIGEANSLLLRALHYFDRIVVEGLGPRRFLRAFDGGGPSAVDRDMRSHAIVLLHLRAIGAEKYLEFREKPHAFCADHFRQHAQAIGLSAALDEDLASSLVQRLASDVRIEGVPTGEKVTYLYRHPWFDSHRVVVLDKDESPPTREAWAHNAFVHHCVGEIGDIALAREARLPLMSTADKVIDLSRAVSAPPSAADEDVDEIGLHITLPIMTGMTPRDLLAIRDEYRDEFSRFRAALVSAIRVQQARLASADDPKKVARAVRREFIEPELAGLESRMRASRRAMGVKLAENITIAGATAAIGILTGIPILLPAAVAIGGGASVAHLNKHTDNSADLQLHDLYFLWRVAHRHAD